MCKLPESAIERTTDVHPLQKVSMQDTVWYSYIPTEKYTLSLKVKRMCEEARITGHKTNSANGITEMCEIGASEKVIERSGHKD